MNTPLINCHVAYDEFIKEIKFAMYSRRELKKKKRKITSRVGQAEAEFQKVKNILYKSLSVNAREC